MESALDSSLDKVISSTLGYCRFILKSEQKKNDFLSDELVAQATAACRHLVTYLHKIINHMKNNLDGGNIDNVLSQFGSRLHTLIFDHLQGKTETKKIKNFLLNAIFTKVFLSLPIFVYGWYACNLRHQRIPHGGKGFELYICRPRI